MLKPGLAGHRLGRLARSMLRGQPGIYPTESSYALGANPACPAAVARLCARKGRPSGKALPLIAADFAAVLAACHLPSGLAPLAAMWPGPLALVLPLRRPSAWPPGIAAADGSVAVRVSSHPWAQALAAALGGLVIATSANWAGHPPWVRPQRRAGSWAVGLRAAWAGQLAGGPPSTQVAWAAGQVVEVRAGAVSWARVIEALERQRG